MTDTQEAQPQAEQTSECEEQETRITEEEVQAEGQTSEGQEQEGQAGGNQEPEQNNAEPVEQDTGEVGAQQIMTGESELEEQNTDDLPTQEIVQGGKIRIQSENREETEQAADKEDTEQATIGNQAGQAAGEEDTEQKTEQVVNEEEAEQTVGREEKEYTEAPEQSSAQSEEQEEAKAGEAEIQEQADSQDEEEGPAETHLAEETDETAITAKEEANIQELTNTEQEQSQIGQQVEDGQEHPEEQAESGGQFQKEAEPQEEAGEEATDTEQNIREMRKESPEPSKETMGTSTEPVEGLQQVDPHAPTPVPKFDPDSTATVKFFLLPSGDVSTRRCLLSHTLGDMKEQFAQELKVPTGTILLMHDGSSQNDQMTLADLGVGPNGTIQLEMQSADPERAPITAFAPRQEYHMPDVITVRVGEGDTFKDIVVEIERTTRKKPFLGGYRHKKTNVEYHHASAQTMQKPRPPGPAERFCRDTQTTEQKHFVQQTTSDTSTQMTKIGVYISNMEDKMLVPGHYTTADEYKTDLLERIVVIQKYYRRWLAMRHVDQIKKDKAERLEWERQEEIRKKKEKEDRIRREFERRMNPKTKEDFDLLYHALEKWRQEEMEHLKQTLSGAELKAALCQLLDQETQLLASINRYKLEADSENRNKAIQAFLDKTASPKRWKGPDGKMTEMDTVYTMRAQELRDIYSSINMKYLTQDERLDVLLTLKHTVKEHDCKLTKEIIQLIDREADLLMRGVKEANLEGLRKRIGTLFLQYIKTPTFNPEAARLLKVPQDPSTLRKNIYYCPSCSQYLPSTEFQLSSNSRTTGKCRRCHNADNEARVRQDYSHYRYMLRTLRKSEEAFQDDSKIAFLMQENDLRYLVENVWNSQSILSAWDDLYDLALVRWDKYDEWSPWNCILLTKEESSAHDKLEDLTDAYGKVLIHKVKHRHTLARNYFSRLPGMAEHVRARAESASTMRGSSVQGKRVPMIKT